MIIEAAPDHAVDIPLIWQYIGEIVGAFVGGPSSNMSLIKPILQSIQMKNLNNSFNISFDMLLNFL